MFRVISDDDPNNRSASGSSFTLDIALGRASLYNVDIGGLPPVPCTDLWGVTVPLILQLVALLVLSVLYCCNDIMNIGYLRLGSQSGAPFRSFSPASKQKD